MRRAAKGRYINREVGLRQRWLCRKQMRGLHILSSVCMQLVVVALADNIATVSHVDLQPETNNLNVYYDLNDGRPLDAQPEPNATVKGDGGGAGRRRLDFRNRSNGCSCQALTCGCCTGINIQQFNFNREGCMNFTYDPNEFSLIMNMFMNNNPVYTNAVSAKNPPPFCLPFGVPYLPSVEFCARLFDLHTLGQNLQMCLDFETRVQHAPIFVLHFDCMRMGAAGFALVKPGDTISPQEVIEPNDPILPIPSSTTAQTVTDIDIYDEVIETKKQT